MVIPQLPSNLAELDKPVVEWFETETDQQNPAVTMQPRQWKIEGLLPEGGCLTGNAL